MRDLAEQDSPLHRALTVFTGAVILACLYASSFYNYLLFHSLVEIFSVLIIFVVFVLAWNSRHVQDNHYLLYLGIASVFIGVVELLHVFAFKGFGIFPEHDANLPTQLWISFRYLFSLSFLIALFFLNRKLNVVWTVIAYCIITALLLGSIFGGLFPDGFVESSGLTSFKIISEYIITLIFMASFGLMILKRNAFDHRVLRLMIYSTLSSVAAELSFTQYVSVYGVANLFGHLFLLVSVYCIYRAIVVIGIIKPSSLMFRNLKLSEEALQESEERFRQLADAAFEGLVIHADGLILEANKRLADMLGYDPATLVGEMFWEFIDVQYHELVKENVRKGVSAIYEVELIHIDGRRVPAEVMGKSIMWKGQRVRAASLRDITERKLAEEVLQRHTTELEIVNKELESFIYSVSHDLRAPLRAISGFSSILAANAADRLNEKEKDYVERICGGTARMSQLIDDLLDLSRISQTEMQCERADLGKMAATVIAGLRDADPVRNVAVNTQAGLIAEADPRMIELAVSNLLENAWKFTSKKEKALIEFGTVNHPSYSPPESGGEQGRTVYFIRDNGAGFDPAYKDKMFLPFHRLHTRDEFEGTGIGLAIVNRIVHRHGGKLWAEGQVGKGATIYFTLG